MQIYKYNRSNENSVEIPRNSENFMKKNKFRESSVQKKPIKVETPVNKENNKVKNANFNRFSDKLYSESRKKRFKPKHQIIEGFNNIFIKNSDYLLKNKQNYEETLIKICGLKKESENTSWIQKQSIKIDKLSPIMKVISFFST